MATNETKKYLEATFKEMYKAEVDRSDKLDAQITAPIALITVLLGVAAIYVETFPRLGSSALNLLYFLFLAAFIGAIGGAILCLFLSYHHYEYKTASVPEELRAYFNKLKTYYDAEPTKYPQGATSSDEALHQKLLDNMLGLYTNATVTNRTSNLNRIWYLYWTTRCLTAAVVLLFANRMFYYATKETPAKEQTIRISVPADGKVKVEP